MLYVQLALMYNMLPLSFYVAHFPVTSLRRLKGRFTYLHYEIIDKISTHILP